MDKSSSERPSRTFSRSSAARLAAVGKSRYSRLIRIFAGGFFLLIALGSHTFAGEFEPTWESLKNYRTPEWFRDAKFGIWAHWGPQCQPEEGDWYARLMYFPGQRQFDSHVRRYGDPAQFGFKDVINSWKAEKWDPDSLVRLYKSAGAKYFMALANHHDNLDLWDSGFQPWNSVAVGPKKNIIAGWERAARRHGLKFGVSVHASHAWTWYEGAQRYDGNLTKADGIGKWWNGLDPQDLYAQRHTPSEGWDDVDSIGRHWDWENGASRPDKAYIEKFYNRTVDLIDRYKPDLLYFDDTVLPFYPIDDAGRRIAAHFYNAGMRRRGGRLESVLFGKILNEDQRRMMVWDIERGRANRLEPLPWQTDTCLGEWHYRRSVYEQKRYKSAKTVVQSLADIISKNGNLLLNVPLRGDGSIDSEELAIVEDIGRWMKINGEAVYATRPWKIYGEGPVADNEAPLTAQGFNEGKGRAFGESDFRFTVKGRVLYVFVLGVPTKQLTIRALGRAAPHLDGRPVRITLLGSKEKIVWKQNDDSMTIEKPVWQPLSDTAVFRIDLK